uniref:Uncharacterized protein n=1 Tax=Trichogramma kaykai TaxID=54128 RepID=A0ABD2WAU6_9HYME
MKASTHCKDTTHNQIFGVQAYQESVLRKNPGIVIATPGRWIDDHLANAPTFDTNAATIEVMVLTLMALQPRIYMYSSRNKHTNYIFFYIYRNFMHLNFCFFSILILCTPRRFHFTNTHSPAHDTLQIFFLQQTHISAYTYPTPPPPPPYELINPNENKNYGIEHDSATRACKADKNFFLNYKFLNFELLNS